MRAARRARAAGASSAASSRAEEVVAALERPTVRPRAASEPGRVAVLDLLRARTRRFEVVFVLGLEEGSLPRRGSASPFLDDDARRELGRGARLAAARPGRAATATSSTPRARARRERLYLVREAATDDGSPREPSPFWDEVARLFDAEDVRALDAPAAALGAHLAARRRADRARASARARARSPRDEPDGADALARANGWERRLDARAAARSTRPTRLTHPLVLEQLGAKTTFNVTELERFADCSSAWFVERLRSTADDRRRGRREAARLGRAQRADKFFAGLPKELGVERVDARARRARACGFMRALPRRRGRAACAWR